MAKNKKYSREFKESVLRRLEEPTNESIASICEEHGISRSTIYKWINEKNDDKQPNLEKNKSKWSSEDKFQIVLETATLTELELGEYYRRKGIYVSDVKAWRDQCAKANSAISEDPKKLKNQLKEEIEKSKSLEKELKRKEKALAEAAALFVLRKKPKRSGGIPRKIDQRSRSR